MTDQQPAHLWWATLSSSLDPVEAWLDEVELGRVHALTRADDRLRFRLSRALLRGLVGELSGVAAESVRLSYPCARCGRPHGRPVVVAPEPAGRWSVSIAHAGDRVVVAASAVGSVGVDVESVAAVGFGGFEGVALTPAERAELARLAPERQVAARAALWVAKEAILKAGGEGLRVDPATVDVAAWPGAVVPVDVGPGYAAAVAVTLSKNRLRSPSVHADCALPSGASHVGSLVLAEHSRGGELGDRLVVMSDNRRAGPAALAGGATDAAGR